MMYEGEALLGHWLPRALADMTVMLARLGGNSKVERGDCLAAWGLPHTARVDMADDEASRKEGLDWLGGWPEEG